MAELSLTGWLDPAVRYFAEQAGIPTSDYSSQVGGEGIGVSLEVLADLFTKGWFNIAVQLGAGLLATSYAVWGKNVSSRLRRELLALGTHELLRVADIDKYMPELQASVVQSIEALKRGDWNAFLSSIVKTPTEIQSQIGMSVPPMETRSVSTPKYIVSEKTAPPAQPVAGRGKYTITE